MNKSKKIFLGIATFWPILYTAIFFIFVFSQFFMGFAGGEPKRMPTGFFVIIGLHFFTMILMIVLMVIYIMNVFKNESVPRDKKTLWAVVLFLGNFFAMPVYWYLYIWKEPQQVVNASHQM